MMEHFINGKKFEIVNEPQSSGRTKAVIYKDGLQLPKTFIASFRDAQEFSENNDNAGIFAKVNSMAIAWLEKNAHRMI